MNPIFLWVLHLADAKCQGVPEVSAGTRPLGSALSSLGAFSLSQITDSSLHSSQSCDKFKM